MINVQKITIYGLIVSIPLAAVVCEAKCPETCEEIHYQPHTHSDSSSGHMASIDYVTYSSGAGLETTHQFAYNPWRLPPQKL